MKVPTLLDKHTFCIEDQYLFAELSGDYNPMHLDPVIARREKFGEVVVHGVHSLIKCLDAFVRFKRRNGTIQISIDNISAKFPNPVFLNKEVTCQLLNKDPLKSVIGVFDGEMMLTELTFSWAENSINSEAELINSIIQKGEIKNDPIDKMIGLKNGLFTYEPISISELLWQM